MLERGDEQLESAQRVCAVLVNRFVGGDDVAFRFAHPHPLPREFVFGKGFGLGETDEDAVFADIQALPFARLAIGGLGEDLPLVEEAGERFLHRNESGIEQHFGPEAGIEKVHDRVLGAADIAVHRHPALEAFWAPGWS